MTQESTMKMHDKGSASRPRSNESDWDGTALGAALTISRGAEQALESLPLHSKYCCLLIGLACVWRCREDHLIKFLRVLANHLKESFHNQVETHRVWSVTLNLFGDCRFGYFLVFQTRETSRIQHQNPLTGTDSGTPVYIHADNG